MLGEHAAPWRGERRSREVRKALGAHVRLAPHGCSAIRAARIRHRRIVAEAFDVILGWTLVIIAANWHTNSVAPARTGNDQSPLTRSELLKNEEGPVCEDEALIVRSEADGTRTRNHRRDKPEL